jgi:hypothetical protein
VATGIAPLGIVSIGIVPMGVVSIGVVPMGSLWMPCGQHPGGPQRR